MRYQLATILEMKGQNAEAEQSCSRRSIPCRPTREAALAAGGAAPATATGTTTRSALLVELLQRDPYNLDALASFGETLFESGRRADAARRVRPRAALRSGARRRAVLRGRARRRPARYREAIDRWRRVVDLEPASEYARRARRDTRTATDLQRIFAAREPRRANGHRRTAPRARHPRRLPAARPEPEDGVAARDVRRCATTRAWSTSSPGASCRRRIRTQPASARCDARARRQDHARGISSAPERRRRSEPTASGSASCSSRRACLTWRELERQVRLQIETVVFELMSWQEGFFSFVEGARLRRRRRRPSRGSRTESLLMEGARRIDEWARIAHKIPHLARRAGARADR